MGLANTALVESRREHAEWKFSAASKKGNQEFQSAVLPKLRENDPGYLALICIFTIGCVESQPQPPMPNEQPIISNQKAAAQVPETRAA